MYLIQHIRVSFGANYENTLTEVVSVDIDNSADSISGRCTITCPLNARIENANGLTMISPTRTSFIAGSKVKVEAWYEGYPERTLFEGYVYQFREGDPCTIVCEDEAYLLRFGKLNYTWTKKVTLQEILQYVCDQVGVKLSYNLITATFASFYIQDASPLYILERIRTDMGLVLTFVGKELVATVISTTRGETVGLSTTVNVTGCDIQQPDSVWKDFRVEISMKDDKGKITKLDPIGEMDGELRTCELTGMTTEDAKQWAEKVIIPNLQAAQYEGTVTLTLYPEVKEFGLVRYTDKSYPARNGTYVVKRINTRLDSGTSAQTLTLAQIVNDNA
jgi:hypothetical protein